MANNLFEALMGQPHTKVKTEKQQKIIEASIALFAEKGYSNTSTAEIAKAAGVSEGTIFKHYGSKESLLLSVIVPFIKQFMPMLVDEVFNETLNEDTVTFEQFFRAFLKNRVEFIAENKDVFRVLVKEMMYREQLRRELLPFYSEYVVTRYKQVLEGFISSGDLPDGSTDQMVQLLVTFIFGFLVSRFVLFDLDTVSDDEIERAIRFVMDGIKKGA